MSADSNRLELVTLSSMPEHQPENYNPAQFVNYDLYCKKQLAGPAMFDDLIEEIRKNPRHYALEQLEQLDLDSEVAAQTNEQLVALLFACAGFELHPYFERIDQELRKRDDLGSLGLQFHYHVAKGLYTRSLNQVSQAIQNFSMAHNDAIALGKDAHLARCYVYLATCFDLLADKLNKESYLLKALKLVPELEDKALVSNIYMAYGHLNSREQNSDEYLNAFLMAKQFYDQIADKEKHLNYSILLLNLGRYYVLNKEFNQAQPYIEEGLRIVQEQNFYPYVQRSLKSIAELYAGLDQLETANQMLSIFVEQQQQALSVREQQIARQQTGKVLERLKQMQLLVQRNHQLQQELESMQRLIVEKKSLSHDQKRLIAMQQAVRNQEFVPFYQAKQALKDGSVAGFELLCRWRQGDQYLSPARFIEYIENHELVFEFSEQLFRQGIQEIASLIRNGQPQLGLALNVSPFQLANQELGKLLSALCVEYGIASYHIDIEVIERTFLEHDPKAIKQLFELKQLGFGISLDDFGSGYSSLACLIELPLDSVKIDRSLVQNIEHNDRARQLFINIVNMLHDFKMDAIAEGVETQGQLELAKAHRCQQIQGFLWHKPCDFHSLCQWLEQRKPGH